MEGDRVPTGIDGLDPLIGGGFPRGSLILLAGNPGTGKTVFATQFCFRGARDYGEPGVYVSFAESEETLIQNMVRHFKCDLDECPARVKGTLRILDFATTRKMGISDAMNMILGAVQGMGARRLVIDSFSAMAQAFKEPIDARIILHTILGKMTRQLGCTTILTVEIPTGREEMGLGMEEFVADGVLILRRGELEGRLLRELEIAKLRGTEVKRHKYLFTLHTGFHIFPPTAWREVPPDERRLAPVYEDKTPETVSTCVEELDRLLGGGWRKGSLNLLEVGEGVGLGYAGLVNPLVFSSVNMGRSFYEVPSGGISSTYLSRVWPRHLVGGSQERLKIAMNVDDTPQERPDHLFEVNRSRPQEAFERFLGLRKRLKERSKDGIQIDFMGCDTLEYDYGPERTAYQANVMAKLVKETGDIQLVALKEGQAVSRAVTHLADTHWRFRRLHGALLFYGVVPETGLYVMETDLTKGYPETTITPIV